MTAEHRMKCQPAKLELVKNTNELPKSNRAIAHRCPYNLRKTADELIEDLHSSGIIKYVLHHTDFTSVGSFIPKKNKKPRLVIDYCTTN